MKDERDNKVVPFPARLLTRALVLTGIMLAAMAWSGVDSYRNIATVQQRDLRVEELRGTIVHLDEVLTMSARMAAATADPDWERRYRQFEPQLDAAIKEGVKLTAHSDSAQAAAQTDAANLKLIEMENQGFTLVRAGEAGRAKAVLFSNAYEAQKKIYAEGTVKLIQHLKEQLIANQRQKQREAFLPIIAVAFGIVLLLLTLSVLRKLNYWRTMQSGSLDALTRAEEALRKLNDGLEQRVEDRTRTLQLEIRERKDVETALRGSDEKFRQLAENITDAFWIRSPDMREVHYVSPAFERIWGRSTESLYANPHQWADAILPEDRERVLAVFATLTGAAPSLTIEYRIARPDGEVRWVHVRGFQVRDAANELIRLTGIVTDITERKRAEEAMRETEERFSGAFEYAPIGVALVSSEGRWLKVNRALCDLVGYSEAELLNRTFEDITHPEDIEVSRENARRIGAGEIRSYQIEKRYVHAGGHLITALLNVSVVRDGQGQPRYFIAQIQDITERKRTEAQRERLADIVEASPDFIGFADPKTTQIQYVNRHGRRMCGIGEDEDIEKFKISDLHPAWMNKRFVEIILPAAVRDGLWEGEGAFLHRNGREIPVLMAVLARKSANGETDIFYTVSRDITDRKQAERALGEREAEFRALAEAMPHMVWITRPDGWNIYFNQQWMDYTGLTLEESLAHGWNKPFHPEDQQRAWDAWQHATATTAIYSLECRLRRVDGIYRWWLIRGVPQLDATGNILKWFGTCTDIHDLKLAELEISRTNRALREAEAKYRSIFENSNEGIFQTTLDGRYISANPALARMVGFASPEELIRERTDIGGQGYVDSALRETFKRVLEERGFINGFEYEAPRKDGTRIWISENSRIVRDAAGHAVYYEGSLQDITARKLSEAELEKTHKKLLEASRQAGMAEVATSVLHNVGNVLNSVNVASSCLADNLRKSKAANLSKVVTMLREHEGDLGAFLTSDPKGKQLPGYLAQLAEHLAGEQDAALNELAGLQKNIEHIKDIVAMQQSYGKVSGVAQTMKITDLVEDALRMNDGALTRHDVEVIREYGEVPSITIDKHKVLQVLVNLIRNAKYACDESSRNDKRLIVRVTNGDNRVRIAVADNGVGIPAENLTRIFNHGFTTRKDGHGFGLHSGALAARELGGSLSAHSDGPGKGAVFTLELPLERESSAKSNAA